MPIAAIDIFADYASDAAIIIILCCYTLITGLQASPIIDSHFFDYFHYQMLSFSFSLFDIFIIFARYFISMLPIFSPLYCH
jgi:hypothetical protein